MDRILAKIILLCTTSLIRPKSPAAALKACRRSHQSASTLPGPAARRQARVHRNHRCRPLLHSIYAYCCECAGSGLAGTSVQLHNPRTLSVNTTVQYSITRALSAQVAYVFTQGKNLQQGVGNNNVTALLPAGASTSNPSNPVPEVQYRSQISRLMGSFQATVGSSNYNGLQTKLEQQFSNGLTLLLRLHLFQDAVRCRRLC